MEIQKIFPIGFSLSLHITKEEFTEAVNKATSVNELCKILNKTKPSVYTYASRFKIPLKKRWTTGKRKADGYYHYNDSRNHRRIIEKELKITLTSEETIHHIDGNKDNNSIENLDILDRKTHQKAHNSLEKCALLLMKKGLIEYDKQNKIYKVKGK